jgi:hypothetical protein
MQLKRTDDYENSILVVIILHTGRDTTKCNLSITQMQAGQRDAGQSPSGYEVGAILSIIWLFPEAYCADPPGFFPGFILRR